MLAPRELATVLAALRHWQQTSARQTFADQILAWPQFVAQLPLSLPEIEGLCLRLNEGCDCEVSGPNCCGISGILARIAEGRIVPQSVARCDGCERFPSDAAARHHLIELGFLTEAV